MNIVKIGIFFLILFFGIYLVLAIYVIKNAEKDKRKQSDVILVLGTSTYLGQTYNPCLVARVKHGVDLYKAGYAAKLLFSGRPDETQVMKEIALSLGVPVKDMLFESASTSTYENLLFSAKLLEANQLKSIIIVTEPFHSPRAALVAQKLGLKSTSSPAPNSSCWRQHKYWSHYFLKEPLAIIFYKIKNKL